MPRKIRFDRRSQGSPMDSLSLIVDNTLNRLLNADGVTALRALRLVNGESYAVTLSFTGDTPDIDELNFTVRTATGSENLLSVTSFSGNAEDGYSFTLSLTSPPLTATLAGSDFVELRGFLSWTEGAEIELIEAVKLILSASSGDGAAPEYVKTLNGLSDEVTITGAGSVTVSQSGQSITVSGQSPDLSDVVRTTGNQVIDGWKTFLESIYDNSNTQSINTILRNLYDGDNNICVAWNDTSLKYSDITSLNWGSKLLIDDFGRYSADWRQRLLYDGAETTALDWNARNLNTGWRAGTPTTSSGIANKSYVDNAVNSATGYVTLTTAQTISGVKTFELGANALTLQNAGSSRNLTINVTNGGAGNDTVINTAGSNSNIRIQANSQSAQLYLSATSGRIGVGTTSPQHLLDVSGQIQSSGLNVLYNRPMWNGSGLARTGEAMLITGNITQFITGDKRFYSPTGGLALSTSEKRLYNSGNAVLDWQSGVLQSTMGGGYSIDWTRHMLMDGDAEKLNWNGCDMYDNVGYQSLDWSDRELRGEFGSVNLDWKNCITKDNYGGDSINWHSRTLIYSSQPTVFWDNCVLANSAGNVLNWASTYLYDYYGSSVASLGWSERTLLDFAGNWSVHWGNRVMYDSSTYSSIDWESRRLIGENGNYAYEWGNNYRRFNDADGNPFLKFDSRDAMEIHCSTSNTPPSNPSKMQWYVDEGADTLNFCVRYSDGSTLKYGSIALS